MGRIIIHTKFNKTGKRTLVTPLKEKSVCAPANRIYHQAYSKIETEFKRKMHNPQYKYAKSIADYVANYVASKSASIQETYAIVEYLAYSAMKTSLGRVDVTKLNNIPGIFEIEEKAWNNCNKEFNILWQKREDALDKAKFQRDEMKRQLWREVKNEIFNKSHS